MSKYLFLSHSPDFGVFKVGSHHLARELRLRGHEVAHISTPYSLAHEILRWGDESRRTLAAEGPSGDALGVVHFVPRVAMPMSVAQNRHAIERALKRIQFHDADFVLIDQPLMSAATKLQLPGRIVYRPTDIYPSGVPARRQRQLLRHAHAVIATSAYVLDKLGVEAALPTVVIGNGVEFSRFVARQTGPARSGLVYVGAIDYRFDWKFILSASRAFPHEAFTLYGPVTTNIPRLPANVRLAGPTPYQSIPEILVTARVGLLPLSPVETNLGRSPMKLYEYIAAGLPVVTRRRGPGWDSELDRLVFTYNDADDAIGAVEKALSAVPEPDLTKRVASSQDWSHKAAEVEAFLDIVARE